MPASDLPTQGQRERSLPSAAPGVQMALGGVVGEAPTGFRWHFVATVCLLNS